MPQLYAKKWICRRCGRFMPRAEAEALVSRHEAPADGAACSLCGAPDALFARTSPEGADFISDMTFDAYTTGLREAGYEIVLYSAQCNKGDHQHCTGKNGLAVESPQDFSPSLAHVANVLEQNRLPQHCFCPCHKESAALLCLPSDAGPRFKVGWKSFIKSCWQPVYDMARKAGLVDAEARRVADEVTRCVTEEFPWKDAPDEESFRQWLQELTHRQISAIRENRPEPVANSPQGKKWWQFWK